MLFDGNGTMSCGWYEFVQVQADRCFKCAMPTAVRECADGVYAEDARRCWSVLAAESGRAVSKMTERNCGGAAGREERVRPCGSSNSFQGDEIAKSEPFLVGLDRSNLEWKLHALGHGNVEQSTDESWTAQGARESPVELAWSFGRLCVGNDLRRRRCGSGSCVGCCCGGDGGRSDRKIEGSGFDRWCREHKWTSHPKMIGTSIRVGGLAVLWEEVLEFVGSKVSSGWTCKTCDCTQTSPIV